jgi:hypothetical protein
MTAGVKQLTFILIGLLLCGLGAWQLHGQQELPESLRTYGPCSFSAAVVRKNGVWTRYVIPPGGWYGPVYSLPKHQTKTHKLRASIDKEYNYSASGSSFSLGHYSSNEDVEVKIGAHTYNFDFSNYNLGDTLECRFASFGDVTLFNHGERCVVIRFIVQPL